MNPTDVTGCVGLLSKIQKVQMCDFHPDLLARNAVISKHGRPDGVYKWSRVKFVETGTIISQLDEVSFNEETREVQLHNNVDLCLNGDWIKVYANINVDTMEGTGYIEVVQGPCDASNE